jgi:hypothetical protein
LKRIHHLFSSLNESQCEFDEAQRAKGFGCGVVTFGFIVQTTARKSDLIFTSL